MWRTCIYLGQLGALGWDAHGGRDDRHTKRPAGASEQASWHQKAGRGHLHACRVREVARGHMESTWQQVGSARPPRRPHGQNTASAPAPACVGQPSRRLAGCRAACRPRAVLQERATATIEKDGALGWIGETGIIWETAIRQMADTSKLMFELLAPVARGGWRPHAHARAPEPTHATCALSPRESVVACAYRIVYGTGAKSNPP